MSDIADDMKRRTMQFALDVCALILHLPDAEPGPTVRRQLAKASTGLAINYRASCRARSHAEFTAKTGLSSKRLTNPKAGSSSSPPPNSSPIRSSRG